MDKPEITIDDLAQEIRRVIEIQGTDEDALAEALMPFIEAALSERNAWRGIETAPHDLKVTQAEYDVCKERTQQVIDEGWTAEHDDTHTNGELALAACVYAMPREEANSKHSSGVPVWRVLWPWDDEWLKITDRRRDLVKAAALIIAEIERIDRLPSPPSVQGEQ